MYEVPVMLKLRKLLAALVLGVPLEQKKSRCRIICTDRVTGDVSEQPWYGIEREEALEEYIKNFKGAPLLGSTPLCDRFEFKIDHA